MTPSQIHRPATAAPAGGLTQAVGPRIYYLHPLLAGALGTWAPLLARIARLGFDHVLVGPPFAPARHGSILLSASHEALHPALDWKGDADSGIAEMARQARGAGLALLLDVVPDRVANGSALALAAGSPFSRPDTTLDPRRFDPEGDAAHAPLDEAGVAALAGFWVGRLRKWVGLGVAGARLLHLDAVPPALVGAIAAGLGTERLSLLGWMAGVRRDALAGFEERGLAYVFSSLPWWDGQADWFWREAAALRRIAPVIEAAEAPFGPRLLAAREAGKAGHGVALRRGQTMAALLGSGWMLTMGAEFGATGRLDPRRDTAEGFLALEQAPVADLSGLVGELNAARAAHPALSGRTAPRLLSAPGEAVLAFARPSAADPRLGGDVVVVAVGGVAEAALPIGRLFADLGGYCALPDVTEATLPAGGFGVLTAPFVAPARTTTLSLGLSAQQGAAGARIAIEAVSPAVDQGRFAARVIVGETVTVEADLICDGHDVLAGVLRWQGPGDGAMAWHEVRLRPLGNDRWGASFVPPLLGTYRFTVEAWKDVFATYRDELGKKVAAGLDVTLEVEEGRLLLEAARSHAGGREGDLRAVVGALRAGTVEAGVALLLSDATAALLAAIDAREFSTWIEPPYRIEAERTAARFASWYEIFPRSTSGNVTRHGTFDDVIAQLPRIAGMGFDVLYFPPVHPIGKTNRKGRNNTLTPGPDDPGSPYGIADHTALHPELGSFEDFARLRDAALAQGLELALDFAIQCAPDHPWLTQHRGWFDWRPDGSIKYAENPPKKYQDIVNVDFYRPEALDSLWRTLCEVVLFWCDHGVRIFRVDNPHTKPLPFWQWMIAEVHARHPDVLFLAEAFTKPKMMNRLAKVGFSQSYTYFTWRNTKAELAEYLMELNTTAAAQFFRPNFFVNTPDINPVFLQNSGRAGHLIRTALAALLSGLWGVYSGFELCEASALPGREEYGDSEKYEIRAWDWGRPGNIVAEITQLNWIRRLNPALQTHLGVTFLYASDDHILYFEKATADRANVVLVAINLDPFNAREANFEVPLWRWKLPDHATVEVEDLVFEQRYRWTGKVQHVRLDPYRNPYAIWRVRPG